MAKLILFDDEARQALKVGVDAVAQAVKVTLGPRGRNVAIDRRPNAPMVTHDGVTVAKDIELPDPFENMGAQLVKTAALRTNEVTGDGTTTATVIAQAIVTEGLHMMAAGANPMLIKRGLDRATEAVVGSLRASSRPIQGRDDIAHVATISAADPEIGEIFADLLDKAGKDGVITVEESRGVGLTTEFQEGIEIDHGWTSPFFITDEARQEAVLEDALIFISHNSLTAIGDVVPLLERLIDGGEKCLLIICDEVDKDALSTLVLTKVKGSLNILAVKPPGYGDRRKLELEDLAIMTGANPLTEESGRNVEDVTLRDLGRARRVVAGKDRTTIVGGYGSESAIQTRIQGLRGVVTETTADYDREWFQKRLARLSNGIGVIRVGANTQVEAEEKKLRVEDALAATRAAVEEGIVPGGGVALLNAAAELSTLQLPGDVGIGVGILQRAIEEPLRYLAENSGLAAPVVVGTIRRLQTETGNLNIGCNVVDGSYVDLLEAGIIDPVKVVRVALENAVSVASLVLTAEALVAEPPDKPVGPKTKPTGPVTVQ